MVRINWIAGGVLLSAWVLPLHVPPWMSWQNEWAAAAATLLGCSMALFRRNRESFSIGLPTVVIPMMLLAALALLQVATRIVAYWGSFYVIFFYAAIAVAASAAGFATGHVQVSNSGSEKSSKRAPALITLAKILSAAGLVQLFLVLAQTFQLYDGADWIARTAYLTRGAGNLAQPNHCALVLLLSIASVAHLYHAEILRARISGVLVLLMAVGLSVTESRSGLASFFVLACWWTYKGSACSLRRRTAVTLGMLTATSAMFASWPAMISAVWHLEESNVVNLTTSGRLEMWRQLVPAALSRPWLGWGIMQVAEAQNSVAHLYPTVMAATFSHNFWLDLVLWVGIPASCIFFLMVGIWGSRRVRIVYSNDSWYCMSLVLPIAVQAMTEFPYAYSYFLIPLFFALGALDSSLGKPPWVRVSRNTGRTFLAVLVAGFFWASVEYVKIEEDFRVVRFEALRVGKTPDEHRPPDVVVLTQLGGLLRAMRSQPTLAMASEEIEALKTVAMLYPSPPLKLRYLIALALNDQPEEARRQLAILRNMHGVQVHQAAIERLAELSETYHVLKAFAAP